VIFIGVDPDVHHTALAAIDDEGLLVGMHMIVVPSKLKGPDAVIKGCVLAAKGMAAMRASWGLDTAVIAVENQEISYTAKSGKNPRSMLPVAQVAGAYLTCLNHSFPVATAYFPTPAGWKGQVPKQIHQARICKAQNWEYLSLCTQGGYCQPTSAPVVTDSAAIARIDSEYGKSAWKHMLDALGLAQWARARYISDVRKSEALAKMV